MEISGLILKGLTSAYRYARYGKQIGKTAKDGVKVYSRAGKTTAVRADGSIKRTVQKTQRDKFVYHYDTKDYLPFGQIRNSNATIVKDGKNWQSSSVFTDRPYSNIESNRTADGGTHVCTDREELSGVNHRTHTTYDKNGNLIFFKY